VLHDVKKITTLRFHALRGSKGPFWQHQFWDRFVRHERKFKQRLEYMHMNPVRRGLVKRPEDWVAVQFDAVAAILPRQMAA
jgi:REP element-mobilizing transposase RayT